jgi:hypothetical protein
LVAFGATLIAGLAVATAAKALRIAVPASVPAQSQALHSDTIVVGKVIEIEKEAVKAKPFPASPMEVDYKIAVVKINEELRGAKGVTSVRVGFTELGGLNPPLTAQPDININRPIARPTIARIDGPAIVLTAGQEGLFCLVKHHEGDFYVLQQYGQPLEKKAPDYEKQLANVKKLIAALENPKAALKDGAPADRAFAAVMLVEKYCSVPPAMRAKGMIVQEPIDAEESKLILEALSQLEWNKPDANGLMLQTAFYRLGLQAKDGWTQPKFQQGQDFSKAMGEAAAKWLKANTEKYVIQRRMMK